MIRRGCRWRVVRVREVTGWSGKHYSGCMRRTAVLPALPLLVRQLYLAQNAG